MALATQVEAEAAKLVGEDELPGDEEVDEAWNKAFADMAYFPDRQAFGRLSTASKQDRLSAVSHQLDAVASQLEKDAKKVRGTRGEKEARQAGGRGGPQEQHTRQTLCRAGGGLIRS